MIESREKTSDRLKVARSIAGYSNRKDFCSHFDISYDTLDAWERGKNPLTPKGAKRFIDILKSVGIYCSEEWLIKGEGLSPRPLKEIVPDVEIDLSNSLTLFEQNISLATEISTFTTLNKDSIITIIRDESMLPFYEKGDYVGGIRLRGDNIVHAINKRCIAEFSDEQLTVGQLQQSNDSDFYIVDVLNRNTHKNPERESVSSEIVSVAPILWHRTFFCITKELEK